MRRFTNFQRQMMQRQWETPDVYPFGPITLFDFTRVDDAADVWSSSSSSSSSSLYHRLRQRDAWRLSDDRVIGGYSESSAHLIRPSLEASPSNQKSTENASKNYGNDNNHNDDDDDNNNNRHEDNQDHHHRPFIRWYGNLDTTVGLESKAQRSGFAALRSPTFHWGGANLRGAYTALEITCRTDGRVYTINLQVTTTMPNDIFQGQIDVPATEGRWDRLYLPFTEFGFMGAPRRAGPRFASRQEASRFIEEEENDRDNNADDNDVDNDSRSNNDRSTTRDWRQPHFQRRRRSAQRHLLEIGGQEDQKVRLDDKICIESIGFTLMDGQDGPFQFDLAQIRVVNFFEDEVWQGPPKKKEEFVRFRI